MFSWGSYKSCETLNLPSYKNHPRFCLDICTHMTFHTIAKEKPSSYIPFKVVSNMIHHATGSLLLNVSQ